MLKRLFRPGSRGNRDITGKLYGAIVAASRQPEFYLFAEVPDTPLGRYEMLSVHMFLFLHRLRDLDGAPRDLAQEMTDLFISEIDTSLRELGIGDMGIPKRVKKLARMFYGRARSYGEALDAGDREALAAALRRNVRPDLDPWPQAVFLADYMVDAGRHLADQPVEHILRGELDFPHLKGLPS